jgi:tetratricopeptide (TPR) repeat protein
VASILIRGALIAVALLAAAWLALGVRALNLESEARTAANADGNASLSPVERERARRALRDARLLSVDHEPLLNEGLLLVAAGRRKQGIAIAEQVVREEPDYLEGWISLYYLYSMTGDKKRAARVARRVGSLNPLAADTLREAGAQIG